MKKLAQYVALTLTLGSLLASTPAKAQGLNLPGLGGAGLTSQDVAQGNTILVVWTSWSPRCRDIVERMNALHNAWSSQARVVSVNFNEDRADAEKFLQGKRTPVATVLDADGELSKKNAITFLPGLIVYRGGQVAYAGRLPENPDELLTKLLKP